MTCDSCILVHTDVVICLVALFIIPPSIRPHHGAVLASSVAGVPANMIVRLSTRPVLVCSMIHPGIIHPLPPALQYFVYYKIFCPLAMFSLVEFVVCFIKMLPLYLTSHHKLIYTSEALSWRPIQTLLPLATYLMNSLSSLLVITARDEDPHMSLDH